MARRADLLATPAPAAALTVYLAVGNPLAGDDGAGPELMRRLRGAGLAGEFIDAGSAPENHLGRVAKLAPATVVLLDTVLMGTLPGTVCELDPAALAGGDASTHRPPVSVLLDYLRETIPGVTLRVWGIEPGRRALGTGLSEPVRRGLDAWVAAVNAGGVTG